MSPLFRSLLAAVVVAGAGAQSANCLFEWVNSETNELWTWDFSSLSSTNGYEVTDTIVFNGVTYSENKFILNICQNAGFTCNPEGWAPDASTGAVVQVWGDAPACTHTSSGAPYCEQGGTATTSCCSGPCTVLTSGIVPRSVEPYSISALGTGGKDDGLKMFFPTLQDSNTNRSICEPGTPLMAAEYVVFCNPDVVFESLETNQNGCEFQFVIESKYGCGKKAAATTTAAPVTNSTTTSSTTVPPAGMSGGSIFLLILFIVLVLYFGVGTVILRFTTGNWQIPNLAFWIAVGGNIQEGFRFILRGCKRDPNVSTKTAGVYIENNDTSDNADYQASTDEFGSRSHNDDLYDDL